MDLDFDLKYRPETLDDVIGQKSAVATIRAWKHVPRAVLLSGHTGAGKTTLARIIVKTMLNVGATDLEEKNCGVVESPIDMVREIKATMGGAPLSGKHRVWIFDEVQTLSRQTAAQEALLKVLEDGPKHVYFFLCTTEPARLLAAIRGRCEPIAVRPIAEADLRQILARIIKAEGIKPAPSERVLDKIIDASTGSARNAVKLLQKIAGIESDADRLEAVGQLESVPEAFDLARCLLAYQGPPDWPTVQKLLADLKDVAPEGLRQIILAAARTSLLKPGAKNAAHFVKVITFMEQPLYDPPSGRAILAANCYRICVSK